MQISTLLIMQFIAHILADYFFQTDDSVIEKDENGFSSKFLPKHIFIVFIMSWLFSLQIPFFVGAGIIAITHYILDGFKSKLKSPKILGRYVFLLDQIFHILIIIGVVFFYESYYGSNNILLKEIPKKYTYIIISYLICWKPANILIREVFYFNELPMEDDKVAWPNSSKLVGILERFLILTFILIDQFEVVGFLLAAKSVLWYRENPGVKTGYVLIGTMLSFGIAVLLGILVNSL
jgi:hypothetical protein